MALVVPWHAGSFFAIRGEGSILLVAGLWLSHSFRMPLFFLLAGFLGSAVARRRGEREWLRGRVVRLGLPLAIGALALAPLAGLLARWQNEPGGNGGSLLTALAHPQPEYLWFLWYLLLISAGCLGVVVAMRHFQRRLRADSPVGARGVSAWRIPLLAAICAVALWSTGTWNAAPPNEFLAPVGLLAYYAVFFAVGWSLGGRATGLDAVAAHPQRRLAVAILVGVPGFWLFAHSSNPDIGQNPAIRLAGLYLGTLCGWCLIAGSIGFFRRYLAAERAHLRYAADASYWIYLSHMLFLAPLQLLLVGLMPGIAQFSLAVLATFALALITYDLFVRYSAIGRVLHGPRRRTRSARLPTRPAAAGGRPA